MRVRRVLGWPVRYKYRQHVFHVKHELMVQPNSQAAGGWRRMVAIRPLTSRLYILPNDMRLPDPGALRVGYYDRDSMAGGYQVLDEGQDIW